MPTMETAKQTRNVLFLCTGNSARSILSEAILDRLGEGRFKAFSAGSKPVGQVNPGALELLRRRGFSTDGLRSKSWDEFAGPDAPKMGYIVTVCNNAAGETCPIWPGHPATEHWDIDDPADLVRPPGDRALGHRRPGGLRRNGRGEKGGVRGGLRNTRKAHRVGS
jgi:arsenate reductase